MEMQVMKRFLMTIGMAAASIAFGAAPTNDGGEYTYTGSPNNMQTTGQNGDQYWNVVSPISVADFYPGQSDIVEYWQIYTGASITGSGKTRVMKGNVGFENHVIWTGTGTDSNIIGYTGPAKLLLRNGGSLTIPGTHFRIGQKYSDTAVSYGAVFMEEPSSLTVNGYNMIAGNSKPGMLWMDGGTLSVTNGVFKTGGTGNINGYIRINGGVVSLGAGNADFFSIGSANNYGSLHISGGTVSTRRTTVPENPYAHLGVEWNKAADIYIDGGLFDFWNERLDIGCWSASGTTGGRASLTIDGDGRAVIYLPVMGRTGSGNKSTINLNGGRLELTRSFSTYSNTGNSRCVNFNGGTLALVKHPKTTSYSGTVDSSAGDIVVYPKGGCIEVQSGVTSAISTSFRKATGYGVSEITLTNPGSGYVTAPKVTISGGSGSGASAYAIMNKDRTINRIVVTCRGEGYAENDAVTVTIAAENGSEGAGATATATLAANADGVIRKTGAGAWQQTTNDNNFDGEIEVAEGSLKLNGAGFPSASINVRPGASLLPVKGTAASVGCLVATNGIVGIKADGSSGTATLTIGSLSVNQGLALVTYTNGLDLVLTATDSTATSSSASPVVNGLVYAHRDSSAYRNPSLFERTADGSLSLITTTSTSTPGADDNWMPTSNYSKENAPEVSAVNSIIMQLTPARDCYVRNSGNVEIKSGMFVCRRPHNDMIRMNVTGGGAFTTRAKDGMFIYGDTYIAGKRSNSAANDDAVNKGTWRRLFGPFADPDASTPMALTVVGEKQSRPELGAQAWLLDVQTFSGGLNLVNGGVFIQADSGLGASGSPVRASGYCSIASYGEHTFGISHPIQLLEGSALIFSPSLAIGNTVSGALSGSGDLLTSDINRGSCAMAFTGDHSAFTGDYYIQDHARIAPSVFSPLAGICLADGTNGVGVIETSGSFTRPAGTGKGEICWKRFKAYPASYGLRGGFSAFGGDLTVNLGGAGAKLEVGSDYLPDNTVIQLQSRYADGTLTFANGFELGGKTQNVNVRSGKTATISGAVSDEVGGGVLAVTGNLDFAGTLEVAAANIAPSQSSGATSAPDTAMVTVSGDLSFPAGATVRLPASVTADDLAAYKDTGFPLFTVAGAVTGSPALDAPGLGGAWCIRAKSNGIVSLVKPRGTTFIIR